MGWEKMAMAKNKGGMGFRNLHGFNIALMGKHIWNFCCKPQSLVARLFRARYFPEGHILQAGKGTEPSFIWTGIWEAKEQLRAGFRWILGNGNDIRIFKDPWLKGKTDFCVEDSHLNVVRNDKVCSYFRSNSKI